MLYEFFPKINQGLLCNRLFRHIISVIKCFNVKTKARHRQDNYSGCLWATGSWAYAVLVEHEIHPLAHAQTLGICNPPPPPTHSDFTALPPGHTQSTPRFKKMQSEPGQPTSHLKAGLLIRQHDYGSDLIPLMASVEGFITLASCTRFLFTAM